VRVVHFPEPERLDVWCASHGPDEAIVGGFFVRDPFRPLGELWLGGEQVDHEPVPEPFASARACVTVNGAGQPRFDARGDLPTEPGGDLLMAGPLLVAGGRVAFDPATDAEGFRAGSAQFDSDITDGRFPRAALAITQTHLIAVACDGRRSRVDAGLTMMELAELMVDLGAHDAINLDGGGSTTLIHRAHLLNRPYADQDQPAPQSRPVVSALVFEPVHR
jgi:hypothetical protein